ncbi:MAG: prephenate dehydrogenase/arogenate dehydrogenase family protein [Candidatus Caldarchaeum sp.]|nr:prephenate dehydrogenase/arogenate dehydrogenase family protein [Candidatus Caldarchaeum sp.]
MDQLRAAVIGAGPMGLWFARHLARKGYTVSVHDRNRKKLRNLPLKKTIKPSYSFEDAVNDSSVIVIAVGSENSADLIDRILKMYEGKVVVDISSVKAPVVEGLKKAKTRDNLVVLCHPLFGPGTKNLTGKTVLFIPFRKKVSEYRFCKKLFTPSKIVAVSAESHDISMAAAMALPRALFLILFDMWRRGKIENMTVSQRAIRLAASTILVESPHLTTEIVANNPYTAKTIKQFTDKLEELMYSPHRNIKRIHKRLQSKEQKEQYRQIYKLVEK